jgi:hypothetical protein
MTKTLQEIQEFNRRKIICAVNGTEDYEEALKKEEGVFCDYLYQTNYGEVVIMGDVRRYGYNRDKHYPNAFILKVIGKPLTLDRVLLVLKNYEIGFVEDSLCYCKHQDFYEYDIRELCKWDLTKPTLEEQSEETQRAIYELLGGENE